MIEVDRLSKRFGSKSTTFRIACGMLRADSGAVRVDGISSSEDRIFQSRVGALLDHYVGLSGDTARDNFGGGACCRVFPNAPSDLHRSAHNALPEPNRRRDDSARLDHLL